LTEGPFERYCYERKRYMLKGWIKNWTRLMAYGYSDVILFSIERDASLKNL
jgi:hypothetical protein